MRKPTQFKVKHVIVKTSKEELELHMKQAVAALLKMAGKERPVPKNEKGGTQIQ